MTPKEFLLTFPDIEEAVSNGYDIRLSEQECIYVMKMYSSIQVKELKKKIFEIANTDNDGYEGLGVAIDTIKELTRSENNH